LIAFDWINETLDEFVLILKSYYSYFRLVDYFCLSIYFSYRIVYCEINTKS